MNTRVKYENEYEIVVKPLLKLLLKRKVVTALGVPKIFTDIKKQSCRFAVENMGFCKTSSQLIKDIQKVLISIY